MAGQQRPSAKAEPKPSAEPKAPTRRTTKPEARPSVAAKPPVAARPSAEAKPDVPVGRKSAAPLSVSRSVVAEMVRIAALEVPGVLKVSRGSPLRRLAGSPVRIQLSEGRVSVRVWVIARPNHALAPLTAQVRQAVGAAIERLLNLEAGEVTVVIDGVGAP